ncbi:MAG: hypothetical protein AAGJ32_07105 [Pseudomonadota bacterium]
MDPTWTDGATAQVRGVALDSEGLSLVLMRALRSFASASAEGRAVAPVSVTLDVTGSIPSSEDWTIRAGLDRRTRTLVFSHAEAFETGAGAEAVPVMAVTGVYRIEAG